MADTTYNGSGLGPTGGAVATGAISTSTYEDNSTTTSTVGAATTTVGGANYAAQIGIGNGASGNTITSTTTDFGAINAAEGIATTAINANTALVNQGLAGQALLTQETGEALNTLSTAIANKSTPISQTVAKYSTYIVGIIALAIVAGLAFVVWPRRREGSK